MDDFVLDWMQLAAHYIHEKTGLRPVVLAQIFGVASIVSMMTRHWLLYGSMDFTSDMFWDLALPGTFLAFTFIPNRTMRGRNPMRFQLLLARMFFFLMMAYQYLITFMDETVIQDGINYIIAFFGIQYFSTPFWPSFLYATTTLFIWAELCLISIDNPPPREVRVTRAAFTTT